MGQRLYFLEEINVFSKQQVCILEAFGEQVGLKQGQYQRTVEIITSICFAVFEGSQNNPAGKVLATRFRFRVDGMHIGRS